MRANTNAAEKERMKRVEEESRRRQMIYDTQINEKRQELRRQFDLHSIDVGAAQSNGFLQDTEAASQFKKELDRLATLNSQKKISLEKLVLKEKTGSLMTITESGNSKSEFRSGSIGHQQQFQHHSISKASRSRQTFSQSYYRSTSLQFMASSAQHNITQVQQRLEEVDELVKQAEQNVANESERQEALLKMQRELSHSVNQGKERMNHQARMNEIADTRYKDIHHIDVQANENKRIINLNVDQVKDQISCVERMYTKYRDRKSGISKQLKSENEQEEYFLSNVQIKIEEATKQNEALEREIAALEDIHLQREIRERESFYTGQYISVFEAIQKFILKAESSDGEVSIEGLFDEVQEELQQPTKTTNTETFLQLQQEEDENHIKCDRNLILSRMKRFYEHHKEDIHPFISKMNQFYKQEEVRCLLLQNQCSELISEKTIFTQELQVLEEKIEALLQDNFFLNVNSSEGLTGSHAEGLTNSVKKNKDNQNSHSRLAIVQDFLSQEIAMDSGILETFDEVSQAKHISTVNVQGFVEQSRGRQKHERAREKQQIFILSAYLSVVELVERFCLMLPLIDFKLEQVTQKLNIFFEFEGVPNALLQACSNLYTLATNGKSLQQQFSKIADTANSQYQLMGKGITSFNATSTNLITKNQNYSVGQNAMNRNSPSQQAQQPSQQYQSSSSSTIPLAVQAAPQIKKITHFGFQHLSYLDIDDPSPQLAQQQTKKLGSQGKLQSAFDNETNEALIEQLTENIMQDKMARYLLTEQFVRNFVMKYLENESLQQKKQLQKLKFEELVTHVMVEVKSEALEQLDEKIAQILTNFSSVYQQINSYMQSMKRNFMSKSVDFRAATLGSNQPPASGGPLSLPRSDYICRSYSQAQAKLKDYLSNEEEDWMQKPDKTQYQLQQQSQLQDANSILNNLAGNKKVSQDNAQKNAIYKFISEISQQKKGIQNKINLGGQIPISATANTPFTQQGSNLQQQLVNSGSNNNNVVPSVLVNQTAAANNNNNKDTGNSQGQLTSEVSLHAIPINNNPAAITISNNSQQANSNSLNNNSNSANTNIQNAGFPIQSQIQVQEDDYIEDERKSIKKKEFFDYEEYKYKDSREKETKQQEDKKKRLVYHRLIDNAETPNTRQEQAAIKQFSVDQDILFKIHTLENSAETNQAEGLNESIKQESNKITTKFAKEFSKLSFGYLKTNKIYHVRKDISTKERESMKEQERQAKYFLINSSEIHSKQKKKELTSPDQSSAEQNTISYLSTSQQSNYLQREKIKRKHSLTATTYSRTQGPRVSIGKTYDILQQNTNNKRVLQISQPQKPDIVSSPFHSLSNSQRLHTSNTQSSQRDQGLFQRSSQSMKKPNQGNYLKNLDYSKKIDPDKSFSGGLVYQQQQQKFYSTNGGWTSHQSADEFNWIQYNNNNNNNTSSFMERNGNFMNASSLLVPTSASSVSTLPVHYKYLQQPQQEWNVGSYLKQSSLFAMPKGYKDASVNSNNKVNKMESSNVIRKAFTSQPGPRQHYLHTQEE